VDVNGLAAARARVIHVNVAGVEVGDGQARARFASLRHAQVGGRNQHVRRDSKLQGRRVVQYSPALD